MRRPKLSDIEPGNISDIATPFRSRPGYILVFSSATIAVVGLITALAKAPVVFPPIGATVFILFAFPLAQEAHPRNVIGAYLLAVLAGMASVVVFGLWGEAADLEALRWERFGATMVGFILVVAALTAFRLLHIPAVAATMMISLGLIFQPYHFAVIMVLVLVVVGIALGINRAFKVPQPVWSDERAPGGVHRR